MYSSITLLNGWAMRHCPSWSQKWILWQGMTARCTDRSVFIMESCVDTQIRNGTANINFPLWIPKWIHRSHDAVCEFMLDHEGSDTWILKIMTWSLHLYDPTYRILHKHSWHYSIITLPSLNLFYLQKCGIKNCGAIVFVTNTSE